MASELVSEAISCAIEYPYLNLTLELSGGEAVRLDEWLGMQPRLSSRTQQERQLARQPNLTAVLKETRAHRIFPLPAGGHLCV